MSLKTPLLCASALSVLAGMLTPAYAQQLEEITVTARKVEENLMTVPIAITAFSAKDLNAMGVTLMNDIARFTPGFNFVNQTGGSGRNDRSAVALTFRGLFVNNATTGAAGGGSVFIDGAPVITAQGPSATDVERIEVLKGPQSVFFGRSTFSGAAGVLPLPICSATSTTARITCLVARKRANCGCLESVETRSRTNVSD